jgi:hypothetical protein
MQLIAEAKKYAALPRLVESAPNEGTIASPHGPTLMVILSMLLREIYVERSEIEGILDAVYEGAEEYWSALIAPEDSDPLERGHAAKK